MRTCQSNHGAVEWSPGSYDSLGQVYCGECQGRFKLPQGVKINNPPPRDVHGLVLLMIWAGIGFLIALMTSGCLAVTDPAHHGTALQRREWARDGQCLEACEILVPPADREGRELLATRDGLKCRCALVGPPVVRPMQ